MLIGARLAYAAISLGLFADHGPLWFLAILRAGQGACGGAYTPALLAALIDLTPPDGRATRFSQLQRAELGGVLIGPLIGGAVATWRDFAVFGVAGLAVLLGLGAVFRVPETREEPVARDDGPGALAHTTWWRGRGVLVPCLALGCVGLVFTMYDVVWPQYLAARGVSTFVVGLSITLFAAPMVVLATPAGRLADRADRRVVLGVALTVVGACAATYPFLHTLAVILVLGTVEACAFVARRAVALRHPLRRGARRRARPDDGHRRLLPVRRRGDRRRRCSAPSTGCARASPSGAAAPSSA